MGWFNVLKGAYPSLQQIDKTLPLGSRTTGITRGSLIYQLGNTFELATSSQEADPTAYVYISLVDQNDLTAGMAGSRGQGAASGIPVITGIAMGMPFEFETSEWDTAAGVYNVGSLLGIGDAGKLTLHATGNNCVAQVTKVVRSRWVNDAIAVTGFRTGANVNVLTARTLYIPLLVTAP